MIGCVNCNSPLVLNIDAKNNDFKCKECGEKYGLVFENKMLKILNKKKQIKFFINDLSSCDKDFSLKNVYEMYNKGYLDCVKMLNSKYNQSDNFWQLSINKLTSKISHNINIKLSKALNSTDEVYSCNNCMSEYSSEDALSNNYSCIICSSQLVIKNNLNEIEELKKNLIILENNWSTSF